MRFILLLFVSLFATGLLAQQKISADSLKNAKRDTSKIKKTGIDTLGTPKARKGNVLPFSYLHYNPVIESIGMARIRTYLFEDLTELLDQLPETRTLRTGDVGYFAEAAFRGQPPRFTQFQFDHIPWPVGLYGQSNLTAIPETFADHILLAPNSGSFRFFSAEPKTQTTWTYLEYVDGPFGSDALRLRLRRPLSRHLRTYWSTTFANSDGQPIAKGREIQGGPYDANRIYGRIDRSLGKNDDLRLRYRFIKSLNEVTVANPFFFEEFPDSKAAKYKESRLFHNIELSHLIPAKDTLLQKTKTELWRIRLYRWDIREEYRDDPIKRLIQQQIFHTGMSINWQTFRKVFRLQLYGQAENLSPERTTIQEKNQLDWQLRANVSWNRDEKFFLRSGLYWHYRNRFRGNLGASTAFSYQPVREIWLSWGLESRVVLPEPGEYANQLPGILKTNFNLQPMRLSQAEAAIQFSKASLQSNLSFRVSRLDRAFMRMAADSVFQMINTARSLQYASFAFSLDWRPLRHLSARLLADGNLQNVTRNYLFWYLPSQYLRFEFAYDASLFENDLLANILLTTRYYGMKYAPHPAMPVQNTDRNEQQGFWLVDAILRLHFKDAIIFLNFENLLDQKAEWRPGQPIRPRVFRLGINWLFLD